MQTAIPRPAPGSPASTPLSRVDAAVQRPTRIPTHYGYTLLELMIVLMIIVAMTAMVWPRMRGRMQSIAPREAGLQLKSDLIDAREQAVLTGEPWIVRIQRGTRNYEVGPLAAFVARESTLTGLGPSSAVGADTSFLFPAASQASVSPEQRDPFNGSPNNMPTASTNAPEVQHLELPDGMIFDDGYAHQVQDANLAPSQMAGATAFPPAPVQPSTTLDLGANANSTLTPPGMQPTEQSPLPQMTQAPASFPATDSWKYAVIYQTDGRATESEIRLKEQVTQSTIRLRIRGFTGAITIDGVQRKPPEVAQDPLLDDLEWPAAQPQHDLQRPPLQTMAPQASGTQSNAARTNASPIQPPNARELAR